MFAKVTAKLNSLSPGGLFLVKFHAEALFSVNFHILLSAKEEYMAYRVNMEAFLKASKMKKRERQQHTINARAVE